MSTEIILTDEQELAIAKIDSWLLSYDRKVKPYYVFSGSFGVGKSTVISYLKTKYDSSIVMAFTGKACQVLRDKGVLGARTIHSTIFRVVVDEITKKKSFIRLMPSELSCGMFIIDESSMISQKLHNDLLSFGIPIIYVGDSFQLGPVDSSGNDFNLMIKFDHEITTIHRQAAGSPIIKLCSDLREDRAVRYDSYGDKLRYINGSKAIDLIPTYDQVICYTNLTRLKLNKSIRELKGITSNLPVAGERVMCLMNKLNEYGVLNGEQFTLKEDAKIVNKYGGILLNLLDDDNGLRSVISNICEFYYNPNNDDIGGEEYCPFTFAYCISGHKSQGSEYDKVLIVDELRRLSKVSSENKRRWMYTASSRAKYKLDIVNVDDLYPIL